MGPVDNFNSLVKFIDENIKLKEGEYILVSLILRKKDKSTTFGNKNNSSRLIKSYNFFSTKELLSKKEEIIKLCEMFKCRAGLYLNKRNEEYIVKKLNVFLSERILSGNYRGINGILNSVNEKAVETDKFWLIDVDDPNDLQPIIDVMYSCRPFDRQKDLLTVPTYTGYHIISRRFDREMFHRKWNKKLDIFENSLTGLYYPKKEEPI